MKWHGISIYNNNDFQFTLPRIFTNGNWYIAIPYIYTNNAWKIIGEACIQMIPFIDSNNSPIYVNGEPFLVRSLLGGARLKDSDNNEIIDINNIPLFVEYRGE